MSRRSRSRTGPTAHRPPAPVVPAAPAAPAILGCWRLIRRLETSKWFHIDLAAPATCDPDWPADYVVKSVRTGLSSESYATNWLRRELEVAQQVSHVHLATVLCGQFDERPAYIVQPWYEGQTVRALLTPGIGISQALWITRQAAEALQALHHHGWVHGDVKPDNLLVSPIGHTTLIDLGFAQQLARRSASIAAGSLQTTVAYAAPELFLETSEPTAKADIYSLGVTLYEMLAGRTPFTGRSPSAVAKGHVHELPAEIRTLNPRVPSRAARLLMQLLLKEPLRRPDAAELVEQLVRLEIECFELVA